MTNRFLRVAVLLPVLAIAACGDDKPNSPTPAPSTTPTITGTWTTSMLVQFRREHDGYAGSFACPGQMTLTQTGSTVQGFVVVNPPCGASSFEVTGTVQPNSDVTLTGAGPRPGAGQCPAPTALNYEGLLTATQVSVRASTTLNCPGAGEGVHRFDYILTGSKR